jgi:hypothetical protein
MIRETITATRARTTPGRRSYKHKLLAGLDSASHHRPFGQSTLTSTVEAEKRRIVVLSAGMTPPIGHGRRHHEFY